MRLPQRQSEILAALKKTEDHYVTPEKLQRMKDQLITLRDHERPKTLEDVVRTREMGDLSENAGYQIAKAKLRGIDNKILTLEERIKTAVLIESGPDASGRIRIGSTVTLVIAGQEVTYQILGVAESNPARGHISHLSPLGKVLLGRRVGDVVTAVEGGPECMIRSVG